VSKILVSHLLKRVLCRLSRKHLLKELSFSVHENTSLVQETSVSVSLGIAVCLWRYNEHTSVSCLGKDVARLRPLLRLSGLPSRRLAMDVRADSDIQAFLVARHSMCMCSIPNGFREEAISLYTSKHNTKSRIKDRASQLSKLDFCLLICIGRLKFCFSSLNCIQFKNTTTTFPVLKFVILSRVWLTIDGVSTGIWIYCPFTGRNYK
jgi:hypothetical protein